MTTVETRVVDPVPSHASVNAVDVSETELVDAAFKEEEKKMLEDEEIDSCEGEDLEEQMINVALMNSVVDSVSSQPQQLEIVARYGLRKRPRPGNPLDGENTVELAMKASPIVVASGVPRATITNGRLSFVTPLGETGGVTGGNNSIPMGEAAVPQLRREPLPVGVPASQTSSSTPKAVAPIRPGRQRHVQQPIAPNVPVEATVGQVLPNPAMAPSLQPGSPRKNVPLKARSKPIATKAKKASSLKQKIVVQVSKTKGSKIASPAPHAAPIVLTSGSVPNPLSQSTPPAAVRSVKTSIKSAPKVPSHPYAQETSVPYPLPAPVPCPLQPQQSEAPTDKRVTIADPPVLTTRNRIFSVDLDPSTFDFPDMSGDTGDDAKVDDVISDIPEDLAPFKRDRAFSFEFFSFAGDDLLPAPLAPLASAPPFVESSMMDGVACSRPRGDSIIFDPSSFQDGGIHEKNAIIKVNAAKSNSDVNPPLLADPRLAAPPLVQVRPQPPKPISAAPQPGPTPSSLHPGMPNLSTEGAGDKGQIATLPSALTIADANGNSPGTFQMELLNKDGRIGIYLPEARRARIARFHAKRKMRIWRKRIKYDCRKKLADSRPRIKGRFVKRSDMDD